jgi:hypothetical protein
MLLLDGVIATELLLGVLSVQFCTICAAPALTNSIQVESDICEQLPAVSLQKIFCSLPPESLEVSPPGGSDGESLLQAEKVNAMAKIAANGRKWLVFIVNSYNNF